MQCKSFNSEFIYFHFPPNLTLFVLHLCFIFQVEVLEEVAAMEEEVNIIVFIFRLLLLKVSKAFLLI